MMLHFTNARLINPETGSDDLGSLTMADGVITALDGPLPEGTVSVDCGGKCLAPGIVDIGVTNIQDMIRTHGFREVQAVSRCICRDDVCCANSAADGDCKQADRAAAKNGYRFARKRFNQCGMDSITEGILQTADGVRDARIIFEHTCRRDSEILTKTAIRVYTKNLRTRTDMAITGLALSAMTTNFMILCYLTYNDRVKKRIWRGADGTVDKR